MNTSAGLVAHTFELYGLGEPPRPDLLYGLDGHAGCDLLTFCRNPLHPGPCKGWKDRLKVVAPGVHRMIEEDRLAKVAKRRADRKGAGKGRDGDGDGKKGEDDSKPDAKKPRKKAAPKPKAAPRVSAEAHAAVADAVAVMPQDRAGWRNVVRKPNPYANPLEKRLAEAREEVAKLQKVRDEFVESETAKNKRRRGANRMNSYELDRHLQNSEPFRELRMAENQRDYYTAMMTRHAAGTPEPLAGEQAARAYMTTPFVGTDAEMSSLDVDENGASVPNAQLREIHAKVMTAGRALQRDLTQAEINDKEYQALAKAATAIQDRMYGEAREWRRYVRDGDAPEPENRGSLAWREWREVLMERKDLALEELGKEHAAAHHARRMRRRELVVDLLAEVRPMRGEKFQQIQEGDAQTVYEQRNGSGASLGAGLPRADWRQQLDFAADHFPDAWVQQSDAAPKKLTAISADRAYYTPGIGVLAMDKHDPKEERRYSGGFPTNAQEITVHELGHRMEDTVPGLRELEFAYVRSRTTSADGVVDQPVSLKALYGGGYLDYEKAYKDAFLNAYTGKMYSSHGDADPTRASAEAFQVGLQDLYSNGDYPKYGDSGGSLNAFTLGVLATLGKAP